MYPGLSHPLLAPWSPRALKQPVLVVEGLGFISPLRGGRGTTCAQLLWQKNNCLFQCPHSLCFLCWEFSPFWNTKQLLSSNLNKWSCQLLIFPSFLFLTVGTVSTSFHLFDRGSGGQEERGTAPVTHQGCAKLFSLATPWVSSLLASTNPTGQFPASCCCCFGWRQAECSKRATEWVSSEPCVSLLLSCCILLTVLLSYSPHHSPVKAVLQIRKAIALGKLAINFSLDPELVQRAAADRLQSFLPMEEHQGKEGIFLQTQATEGFCTCWVRAQSRWNTMQTGTYWSHGLTPCMNLAWALFPHAWISSW